jgi:hypothetical protein
MEQSRINKAVKDCVREALGKENPLLSLQECIDAHEASGWPKAELEILKKTCLRMLSVIYDVSGMEGNETI